mgnify:CR=1 FL=1
MSNCAMCDCAFDPYRDGLGENLKNRITICINCTRKIENYLNAFGVVGGVLDTAKWGLNPSRIPIVVEKKDKSDE